MSTKQPILANNLALPPMPVWQARSFWVQLLMVLTVLLNALGVDLIGALAAMGFGADSGEISANLERIATAVQQLLPYLFGVWAWIERRAPNYRLVWGRKPVQPTTAATTGE